MADEASAAAVAAVGAPAVSQVIAPSEVTVSTKLTFVQPAAVDESTEQANGDTTITKEDEATAGAQTTSEVTAPDGDTTEVAEGPSTGATDATPATGKKEKRKSVSGVPEHKSKKLNKKKSMPTLRLDCEPGEHYWARMKSHPPWPAIICDEQMLPEMLLASRPVSTARPDGGLRDDFKAGGKNARDRTFPVMFLSTNELYVSHYAFDGLILIAVLQCVDAQYRPHPTQTRRLPGQAAGQDEQGVAGCLRVGGRESRH